jgi:plastocyanin
MKRKKFSGISSLMFIMMLVILSMSGSCKKNSDNNVPANEVWMQNTAFNPSTIIVPATTTITWRNKDGMTHTVTSTTGQFDSGNVSAGGNYSHQFNTPGTYTYRCTIHPQMTGTVIVQ